MIVAAEAATNSGVKSFISFSKATGQCKIDALREMILRNSRQPRIEAKYDINRKRLA